MMDEAKDEPMEVEEEDDLVAQAVNASTQRKDQAEDEPGNTTSPGGMTL